ncbi:asparaginase [Cribrihabitans neustonicus]|uniref:asparaginase n=1 Tax=Cribrihabitans neustonicus TaxID=1429085 RepID=UPI003B5C645D
MKRILLIHTGGTIGMAETPDGFAPRQGVVEAAVQELTAKATVAAGIRIETLEPLIDSAEATPADWNRIAETIFAARECCDGFAVTHGTDTLAYTAAALCLALEGLEKPVIVTGAMLPLTVAGSDGSRNLADALNAAASTAPGVWVQFAGKLLHGARVRKSHSSALDSFAANTSAVAPLIPADQPGLRRTAGDRVGVFSVTPGLWAGLLDHAAAHCAGLVLRCYGSGTAPDLPELRAALEAARARQVPVIAVSQCPEGGMRLGTYAAGKVLRDSGVIDGRDITPEMAYVKMHFALARAAEFEARRQYLQTCLCGELTAAP